MGNEASTADTKQHFSPEEREDQNQNLLGLLSLEHETLNTVEKEQRIIPLETPGKNDAEGVNEPDGKEELLEKKGEESDKNGVSKELIFLESNSDSGTITDVGAGDVRASETQKVTTHGRFHRRWKQFSFSQGTLWPENIQNKRYKQQKG